MNLRKRNTKKSVSFADERAEDVEQRDEDSASTMVKQITSVKNSKADAGADSPKSTHCGLEQTRIET